MKIAGWSSAIATPAIDAPTKYGSPSAALSILTNANQTIDGLEDEIFAPFTDSERADLIGLLHRAVAHADLPAGIHPGLVRRNGADIDV